MTLPRSAPADQDVDPTAVAAFLDAVEADPEVELHGFVLVRHGAVVAEGWWAPYTADRPHALFSLSKSVTSTALGLAVADGLVDLDDPVVSHYPEHDAAVTDPRTRSMTLRHLATMTSGHTRETWHEVAARDPEEPVRGFLQLPPDVEPGTVFTYNQPCTYVLADVIQRRARRSLTAYLRPRVLDPLGIGELRWQSWPPGGPEVGFSGLFARTEDVAKLGLLWLQRGRWREEQLLPAAYVDQATSREVDTPDEGAVHWTRGYGFQFWRSADGYRGDGAFGQFCVVLPEHDAVVAITSGSRSMPNVLEHVWTQLLPGLRAGPVDGAGQDELAERLRGLRLPLPSGSRQPRGGRWTLEDAAPFTGVEVVADDKGVRVTLTDGDGERLTFEAGVGTWLTSEPTDRAGHRVPLAAAVGGRDDETIELQVIFLETPHRLTATSAGATATTRWHPSAGLELHDLHRPG